MGANQTSRGTISATTAEKERLMATLQSSIDGNDMDSVFRELGRFMDKFGLRLSADVLKEYQTAGRIDKAD